MPCIIPRYNPNRKIKDHRVSDCIFCKDLPKVLENGLAYAVNDIKPISKGHMLFITKRHIPQIFEATADEQVAIFELINQAKLLLDKDHRPDGYTVQVNCGACAGQIVMHAHVHLIPRYQ